MFAFKPPVVQEIYPSCSGVGVPPSSVTRVIDLYQTNESKIWTPQHHTNRTTPLNNREKVETNTMGRDHKDSWSETEGGVPNYKLRTMESPQFTFLLSSCLIKRLKKNISSRLSTSTCISSLQTRRIGRILAPTIRLPPHSPTPLAQNYIAARLKEWLTTSFMKVYHLKTKHLYSSPLDAPLQRPF